MTKKPNCHKCVHRRSIPGDAHSQCVHPLVGTKNFMTALGDAALGRYDKAATELGIIGHAHGVKMGWFTWPANFDPVWLLNCDGFTSKE